MGKFFITLGLILSFIAIFALYTINTRLKKEIIIHEQSISTLKADIEEQKKLIDFLNANSLVQQIQNEELKDESDKINALFRGDFSQFTSALMGKDQDTINRLYTKLLCVD